MRQCHAANFPHTVGHPGKISIESEKMGPRVLRMVSEYRGKALSRNCLILSRKAHLFSLTNSSTTQKLNEINWNMRACKT